MHKIVAVHVHRVHTKIRNSYAKEYRWILSIILISTLVAVSLFARNRNASVVTTKTHNSPTVTPTYTPTPTVVISKTVKLPIVMYHYVENVLDVGDTTRLKLDTNPAVLANQLEELKKAGYQSYFVEDIPDFIDGKRTLVDKGIVLTFDDGYEDFYTNAFPVLKKYGFKSTLYVISNFVGRKGFLNQTELKDIASSGIVEIGDHTLTHPDLRHISRAKATKEIVQSKADLEKLLNIKIHTFAYPGGGLNSDVVDIVKTASFDAAVSTKPGVYLSDDNMFTLPRIRPGFLTLNSITLFFNKFKI